MTSILSLAAARSPASPAQPSSGDLLGILLTAEGLLFAALAVSISLQSLAEGTYLPKFIKSGRLAFGVFAVIAVVAVGAGSAWYDLFGAGFPQDLFRPLAESLAIAGAIIAQPVLAFAIWRGSVR